jgi:hypothetical protein
MFFDVLFIQLISPSDKGIFQANIDSGCYSICFVLQQLF